MARLPFCSLPFTCALESVEFGNKVAKPFPLKKTLYAKKVAKSFPGAQGRGKIFVAPRAPYEPMNAI